MGTWRPGTIRLVWPEGSPQHGLEVVMRRRTIGEVLTELQTPPEEHERALSDEQWAAMPQADRAERAAKLAMDRAADLAALIVSWNFAPEGAGDEPVPVSAEAVLEFDEQTIAEIWDAYGKGTSKAAPPLPQPSGDGRSPEAALTLPMEPLS